MKQISLTGFIIIEEITLGLLRQRKHWDESRVETLKAGQILISGDNLMQAVLPLIFFAMAFGPILAALSMSRSLGKQRMQPIEIEKMESRFAKRRAPRA